MTNLAQAVIRLRKRWVANCPTGKNDVEVETMTAYWRIRLIAESECTRRAWDRNETGIWYGAWTPADFEAASSRSSTDGEIAAHLNTFPAQRDLGWEVDASYAGTARRFQNIPD